MNKEHRILIFGASGGMGSALIFEAKRRCPKSIIYAALSTRVGSIWDNRLGGWYVTAHRKRR